MEKHKVIINSHNSVYKSEQSVSITNKYLNIHYMFITNMRINMRELILLNMSKYTCCRRH